MIRFFRNNPVALIALGAVMGTLLPARFNPVAILVSKVAK